MIEELIVFFYLLIATIGGMVTLYCVGTIIHLASRFIKWVRRKINNGHQI